MKKASAYVKWIVAAALAAAFGVPAIAAPTLEQMKSDSGLRFSEGAALGRVPGGAEAVWAGGASGRRANLTVGTPAQSGKKDMVPPSPAPPAPEGNGSGTSIGTKALIGLGAAAGAAITAGLFLACGTVPLALLGIAGAVVAAGNASSGGARGWQLVKQTAIGAAKGVAALGLVGAAAGLAAGRAFERIFKR